MAKRDELSGRERRALIEAHLVEWNADALFMDGLDDALIGYTIPVGDRMAAAVYDRSRIIAWLMDHDHLTYAEAHEHLAYNIEAAWMGPGTPLIMDPVEVL